jgi:hypothetical protein
VAQKLKIKKNDKKLGVCKKNIKTGQERIENSCDTVLERRTKEVLSQRNMHPKSAICARIYSSIFASI